VEVVAAMEEQPAGLQRRVPPPQSGNPDARGKSVLGALACARSRATRHVRLHDCLLTAWRCRKRRLGRASAEEARGGTRLWQGAAAAAGGRATAELLRIRAR
jgi:hypothetical protein